MVAIVSGLWSSSVKSFNELQLECGFTNPQVAEFLQVDISTIKRYRNGSISVPHSTMLSLSLVSILSPAQYKKVLQNL